MRSAKIVPRDDLPAQRASERETEISLDDEGASSIVRTAHSEGWARSNGVSKRSVDHPAGAILPQERAATGSAEPDGGYSLDPSASEGPAARVDLGILPGSWVKWGAFAAAPAHVEESAGSPRRAPNPASSTGGLAETLDSFDRQIGLGPSGAVLSAAREAGSWEGAPREGTAQFAVTVLQGGQVAVSLAGFSGDPGPWSQVGQHIEATLRLKAPRIKSSRRGVRLVIELAAAERWPSGAATRSERPKGSVTPPTLQSTDDAKADLEKRNPAAAPAPGAAAENRPMAPIIDAPGVFVGGRGRLGDLAIGAGAFGEVGHGDPGQRVVPGVVAKGNVDPTNIVGQKTRVVSTRVISEQIL